MLHRHRLDPLEAGEPVTIDASMLPCDRYWITDTFGGWYAKVIVGTDDVVTLNSPEFCALVTT